MTPILLVVICLLVLWTWGLLREYDDLEKVNLENIRKLRVKEEALEHSTKIIAELEEKVESYMTINISDRSAIQSMEEEICSLRSAQLDKNVAYISLMCDYEKLKEELKCQQVTKNKCKKKKKCSKKKRKKHFESIQIEPLGVTLKVNRQEVNAQIMKVGLLPL